MAVEARHLNLFPPQFLGNRETMNPIEANGNMYQTQIGYGHGVPTTAAAAVEAGGLLPFYNSVNNITADSIHQQKPAIKSESSLTYNNNNNNNNINLSLPRKRSRDSINPILSFPSSLQQQQQHQHQQSQNSSKIRCSPFSFLGHDISLQMEQQQLDIDHLISQHMEKVRVEIEEKRKRQARKIMETIEGGVMKKLRAKEEEIEKIGKLNWALEERVKSLCIENQIWRDLAQTNEATANALRTNLEQVLAAQVNDEGTRGGLGLDDAAAAPATDEVDDAQSCCGSSWEEEERRTLANKNEIGNINNNNNNEEEMNGSRLCKNCWKVESCVLLLPCRHLCLCTSCVSNIHICPICKSTKNATVHVIMS